ncbi:hypothetical protein SERLADRAFT_469534 [Serpula lacrymans var. lacrymans S7.9]|uniref:Uncharacterized protein n=1 Tax=Serpula lacrymans var. lacrymans (strain S7.9) TaxID=578457 RepID=F8P0H0_SERL9|nr:uncharacterized protein SERLADRAFT_469534 [Serpula lacrymans var. lacrymans S7.9]EGO23525.1 hypothetical protein SERLADRAFT_469534 [Serpula lacrymans var. lacrymans S7.9]
MVHWMYGLRCKDPSDSPIHLDCSGPFRRACLPPQRDDIKKEASQQEFHEHGVHQSCFYRVCIHRLRSTQCPSAAPYKSKKYRYMRSRHMDRLALLEWIRKLNHLGS